MPIALAAAAAPPAASVFETVPVVALSRIGPAAPAKNFDFCTVLVLVATNAVYVALLAAVFAAVLVAAQAVADFQIASVAVAQTVASARTAASGVPPTVVSAIVPAGEAAIVPCNFAVRSGAGLDIQVIFARGVAAFG